MLRLTFICHGPTENTRAAAFPQDLPLAPDAAGACEALRGTLRRADHMVASPRLRARQTAALLGLDAQVEAALDDLDHGRWRGRSLADIQAAEPEALKAWREDGRSAPHGGESLARVQERVSAWLAQQERSRGHILAVSHAAVIRAAVLTVLDAPMDAFWRMDIEPLSLTDLRFDGRRWALRALNVTVQGSRPG